MWRGGERKPLRTSAIVLVRSSLLCAFIHFCHQWREWKHFANFYHLTSIEHFLLISGEKGEKGFVDAHGESCGRSSGLLFIFLNFPAACWMLQADDPSRRHHPASSMHATQFIFYSTMDWNHEPWRANHENNLCTFSPLTIDSSPHRKKGKNFLRWCNLRMERAPI